MSWWRSLCCLLFVITFGSTVSLGQESRFKVLAFYSDKAEPDHVQFAKDAVRFLTERADTEHFTFHATTKWEDLKDERLDQYQLIIWLNESPAGEDERRAFERYMQRGGAWLGFHAAAYNDKDTNWPWFVDFLGGAVFEMNSWPPLPARLVLDDPRHPVMTGIPAGFESPANEWYVWKPSPRLNKDVRVLATLDASNYPIGFKDVLTSGDLPVVWTNTKYRMLYMNMGHGDKIFTSPVQNRLIDNAVNWLGMRAAEPATPGASGMRISPRAVVLNPQTGKFYAVNSAKGIVIVLDDHGRFLTRIPVGEQPVSIAINSETNRIYVSNSGDGTVSVIDGATDKAVTTVPVGAFPYTITANQVTNKIYVSRTFSNTTVVIDGKTNSVRSMNAGVGDAVAADSLQDKTYLISYEAPQIAVLDSTNDGVSRIEEVPNHLWAMAVNAATGKVYVTGAGSANVAIIDSKSHATRLVKTGEVPCSIAVDSRSGRVFVANYASSNITVIDGLSDSVLGAVRVEPYPQAIAVDSDTHQVYVLGTHQGTITIVDGTRLAVLRTIKLGKAPFAIAVNIKTHNAVVVGLDGDLTVIDGTHLTASPVIPDKER